MQQVKTVKTTGADLIARGVKKNQKNSCNQKSKSAINSHTYLGSIAQLVEHLTFNQGVEGSNPSGPTTNLLGSQKLIGNRRNL